MSTNWNSYLNSVQFTTKLLLHKKNLHIVFPFTSSYLKLSILLQQTTKSTATTEPERARSFKVNLTKFIMQLVLQHCVVIQLVNSAFQSSVVFIRTTCWNINKPYILAHSLHIFLWFTKYIPIFHQHHSYVCHYKAHGLCFAKGTNWIFIYRLDESVIIIFHRLFPSRLHYGPGIASSFKRNEYQEHFLESKGGRCVGMTTLPL